MIALCLRVPGAEDFTIFARPIELPEQGFVTSYVVQTESHEFSFLPVRKWHLESNAPEKRVTFVAPDLSASISLRILSKKSGASSEFQSGPLRQWIQERYPKATIVSEFPCFANGGEGLAFDLEQTVRRDLNTTTRLAFIPYTDGMVEFNLTTPSAKFLRYKLALGSLMTSFRADSTNALPAPRENPPPRGDSRPAQ